MAKFTSASAKENGKAVTVTVDSLFDELNGKVDPAKLSKILTALQEQGTEAVLTVKGNDALFFSNRKDGSTLKTKSFPALRKPTTGNPVSYPVTNIRLVKTVTGV